MEVEDWVGVRGGGGWEKEDVEAVVGMRGGRGGLVGVSLGFSRGSSSSSCTVGRGGCEVGVEAEGACSAYCGGGEVGVAFDSSAILCGFVVVRCG